MRFASLLLCGLSLILSASSHAQVLPLPTATPAPTLSPREAYKQLARFYETSPSVKIPQPQGTKLAIFISGIPIPKDQDSWYKGVSLLPDGQLLIASLGTIHMFDSKQAFASIEKFENSLPRL